MYISIHPMDPLFYVLLFACGIEDFRSHRINNVAVVTMALLIVICWIVGYHTGRNIGILLGIVAGTLTLYLLGIIGGGDAKVFILSAFYFDPHLVLLGILTSLLITLLVKKEARREMPLLLVFSIVVIFSDILVNH